jgi:segregation and condensation protein B
MSVDNEKLKCVVEAALMASGQPLSMDRLLALFAEDENVTRQDVRAALQSLQEDCANRSVELVEVGSGFRYQAKQDFAPWVGKLWEEKPPRYSRALLETLALVAYRQPITRGEIEDIRGVSVSSHIIKTLQERDWVRVVGHKDVPGKPALYATTKAFLDYFNLRSLDELPSLSEIRDLDKINAELDLEGGEQTAGEQASEGQTEEQATEQDTEEHAEKHEEQPSEVAAEEASAQARESAEIGQEVTEPPAQVVDTGDIAEGEDVVTDTAVTDAEDIVETPEFTEEALISAEERQDAPQDQEHLESAAAQENREEELLDEHVETPDETVETLDHLLEIADEETVESDVLTENYAETLHELSDQLHEENAGFATLTEDSENSDRQTAQTVIEPQQESVGDISNNTSDVYEREAYDSGEYAADRSDDQSAGQQLAVDDYDVADKQGYEHEDDSESQEENELQRSRLSAAE